MIAPTARKSNARVSSFGFIPYPPVSVCVPPGGMPWARIGELVGHDDITTTSRVYTHVLADERELEYSKLLA